MNTATNTRHTKRTHEYSNVPWGTNNGGHNGGLRPLKQLAFGFNPDGTAETPPHLLVGINRETGVVTRGWQQQATTP